MTLRDDEFDGLSPTFAKACRLADEKVLRLHDHKSPNVLSSTGPQVTLDTVCANMIQQRPVEWIWPGRIARGKQTLIGGEPGAGKSQIVINVIARITRQSTWPDGGTAPLGNCSILSSEDAPEDTIVPRLDAAGADLSRVHIIRSVTEPNKPSRSFSLIHDLVRLGATMDRVGDVTMIMIDPITAYMGSDIDSHRTTDVRAVLQPLDVFADSRQCAVVSITHPPKAAQAKAINAFTGSLAFVAASRMAFVAVEEPETDRRLLLAVKNNLAPLATGIGYSIEGAISSAGVHASRVAWDSAPVTVTANEALAASGQESRKGEARREAEAFLEAYLEAGPMPAEKVADAAKANGISTATLRRAREGMKIIVEKIGYSNGWQWRLP
jgi:putative DNA primase/helicase